MEPQETNQSTHVVAAKKATSGMQQFVTFIREQGVVGLAVGFILGGSVSKVVSSLVDDIINPLIGLILGGASDLSGKMAQIGGTLLKYGSFINTLVDFVIIAAVVYFIFKKFGFDKLDAKK